MGPQQHQQNIHQQQQQQQPHPGMGSGGGVAGSNGGNLPPQNIQNPHQSPQQQNSPAAALPSPLYPWMRSQFGKEKVLIEIYFLVILWVDFFEKL